MLSPDARSVAFELLRPPPGYRLEQAVLTTYSLDLEALLALPLAVIAQSDGGLDELLADPLLLLEALRKAGDRVQVFVDAAGIAVPPAERAIYAMLESSVHPVRAPNRGAFHPKVWAALFAAPDSEPVLRLSVLSRNLTFDRSWDIALTSEATPALARRSSQTRALGELLRALPELSVHPLPLRALEAVMDLAGQLERSRFPAPEGFDGEIEFEVLGLSALRRKAWQPRHDGSRLLAIAPFVNQSGLNALAAITSGERILVSRQESLDELPEKALASWTATYVLSDVAADESADDVAARPSGLHAKIVVIEHGWHVSWTVGSANFTEAAFMGRNVEVVATLSGRKGRKDGQSGAGIDRFLDSGFIRTLCIPYHRSESAESPDEALEARRNLEVARDALLATSALRVLCSNEGSDWEWRLVGGLPSPAGIRITAWPISINEAQSRELVPSVAWRLPESLLTTFVAFRLKALQARIDDVCFVLKLQADGLPEGRLNQVLRTLIDSPERFLRFLRALLGGLDGLVDWPAGESASGERFQWGVGLTGETLLEDLLRVASRDPKRLESVRKLIDDLRSSAEGRSIVPDDLYAVWTVVDGAIHGGR